MILSKQKKIIISFVAIIATSLAFNFFTFSVSDDPSTSSQGFSDKYYVFSVETPKNLTFAGERVPLEQFDVRERLDRELLVNTYWQSNTLLMHKRAARWFPIIIPILRKNKLPEDFKFLALAESSFMNNTSQAGASGFWQFIEGTAKIYGLEINAEIDERYNVEKATEAACRYLKDAYKELGSWALVAASYNMGLGGVQRQMTRQNVNNYYDLLLNEETFRYLFRILALKEVISSPRKYGYHFKKSDLYEPFQYSTITVDSSISNLATFAQSRGTNYKYLKLLNPWLRDNSLHVKEGKSYQIKILAPGFDGIIDKDTKDIDTAMVNALARIEEAESKPNIEAREASPKKMPTINKIIYHVKAGETLSSISKKYSVPVKKIKEWNKLKSNTVKKGDELILEIDEGTTDIN